MANKLKIGIVGCGGILEFSHFPAYLKMDDVELVGFCDIDISRAEKMAKRYQEEKNLDFTPPVFEKYTDLINMEGIEAVDICTPNYLHSIVAVAAFEKGLHVACEKPDAVSVSEAIKMKEASEKAGKVLIVMRNNRFGLAQALKDKIEVGELGEIYAARCGWQRRRGGPPHGSWFSQKEQSGGGPLIDLGVHMIDVSMWLMGNPKPISVSGCTYQKFGNDCNEDPLEEGKESIFDVEDLAMAFVRFDNGACLQVEVSWGSNVKTDKVFYELRGTKAGAHKDSGIEIILGPESGEQDYKLEDPMRRPGGHYGNLRHFVDVVLYGAEPIFTPEQGLNMIKILEAIYTSAKTGREVLL